MKKVIYFASSYGIGLTALLTEQACSLVKNPEVKFLIISGEKEQVSGLFDILDGHSVNYAKIHGLDDHGNFVGLIKIFHQYIDQFKPDVVHVQTNWQLAIVAAVKYLFRRKFLIFYTIHGYRHNLKIRSFIVKYIITISLALFADKIIATSTFLKNQFAILKRKINVLFLGVDKIFFTDYNQPSLLMVKRIIFPGEFRDGKNQDVLVRVIRKYIDKAGDENVELCLPGKGKNLETSKALCRKLGLEEKVFFPGTLDRQDMLKYYLRSQFVVVPTNVETFGLCIAEAFVLGRVVISRRVGVAQDLIIPGKTGYFFNTEEELLEVLLKVLPDINKCSLISKNAFNKRDLFRWDNICDRYFELIKGLKPL